MAIKLKVDPFTFNFATYGRPQSSTYNDEDEVRATFSRPRPTPLTPTVMRVQRRRYNRRSYPDDVHTGHVPLIRGATGTSNIVVDPSSLDKNASLLLASSNLTASSMELGETIGSFSETFGMVSKRLRQIAQFALYLRKGRFDLIAQQFKGEVPGSVRKLPASKRLADGYLEVQFGWLPAMSDVYSAVDSFHNRVSLGQRVNSNGFVGGNAIEMLGVDGRKTKVRAGISTRISASVSNPALRTLNQLGLANPALVAWQLTPFSFVVDWFLPISHILGYYSSHLGLSNVTACSYSVHRSIRSYEKKETAMTAWFDVTTVSRAPQSTEVSWPDLTWQGFNASVGKVLTATALVRQNFR